MPLESLGEEQINVKYFRGEKSEKKDQLTFDPERDISPQDKQAMRDYLNSEGQLLPTKAQCLVDYLAIFPDEKEEIHVENIKEDVLRKVQRGDSIESEDSYSPYVSLFRTFFPQEDIKADEIFFSRSKEVVESNIMEGTFSGYHALQALTVFPERRKELDIDTEEAWSEVKATLEYWKSRPKELENSLGLLATDGARARLLYPDRFQEITIDRELWSRLKNELLEAKKAEGISYFIHAAFELSVLAAEEAYLDNTGQIVIHSRKGVGTYQSEAPPPPITRDF